MSYETVCESLRRAPRRFLVTGAAGFIGSNLVEALLALGQHVTGIDNLSAGSMQNLAAIQRAAGKDRFAFHQIDIRDRDACVEACRNADIILHHAALCSVPKSIDDPAENHGSNVEGFFNMLAAAKAMSVKRFVYASSSAVYGDCLTLPQTEDTIGVPLSPYGFAKSVNEQYAGMFSRLYGLEAIGFRYFNVFGKRQSPDGAYAAVIPKWTDALLAGHAVEIFGDGKTTRDFCHVDNVVQANILAATTTTAEAINRVYNIACGASTSLNELYSAIANKLKRQGLIDSIPAPLYRDFRAGDIRHSTADIALAQQRLRYVPLIDINAGLDRYLEWAGSKTKLPTE